jgi:hypothetical protein
VTGRLRVVWPDPTPFAGRNGEPIRILAISDEPDPALDSPSTRDGLGPIDLIIGAGDLQPEYLSFVTDAFHAPLRYVRGNHDVGAAWRHTEHAVLPEPMPEGMVINEVGVAIIGFSGSPVYSGRGHEISGWRMWATALRAWTRVRGSRPVLVVSHAPPRDVNDDDDLAHRGFPAFRWLAERLTPPLWLHGHTALVRRGIDDRCAHLGPTLVFNCTGATLVELHAPEPIADG